jgi:catechol 2,3-dioxygenase-like lactoylglutathione lyase family enzyme
MNAMAILKPAHYSIRTADLDASRRFYTEVLQLRVGYRPPFNFPGAWLYPDHDESEFGAVHLIGVDHRSREGIRDYFGKLSEEDLEGSGSVDHIAFAATDWPGTRRRFDALRIPYRVQRTPSLDLIQVFLTDPSGVTIELNFRIGNNDLSKGISQ